MKKYITSAFPYPSASGLHIGHWYSYAIVDSYCRLQKYLGNEVFQPMSFDSFGLPTENYAKLVGRDCLEVTEENISNFKQEFERMNTSFQFFPSTHSKEFQKGTKEIFEILLKEKLAYKAERSQPYCSSCDTILAKSQINDDKCERCSTSIVNKKVNQWFFKITDYKDRLIKDLDKVDYPESTKKQQLAWLENLEDWSVGRQRVWGCPIPVEGETDTLDTFVDSSFYTIEYNNERPVDLYVIGSEHATGHLIYSRFITKVLYDTGEIPFDEPFLKVIHQGMILGPDGTKMSKSKGNVVDPKKYEPHILKMYLMFINHYFEGGQWDDSKMKGITKFYNRMMLWLDNASNEGVDVSIIELEKKVINNFENWKTNKVISSWMEFYNKNKNTKLSIKSKNEIEKLFEIIL